MMTLDEQAHCELATLFQPAREYAGYKPEVREAPNGDGNVDAEKRYLHINLKYHPPSWAWKYFARAHLEACRVAEALGVPDAFYPRVENGTLRVLEYPPGAGSAQHTDFNLFTILCWRSTPEDLERLDGYSEGGNASYPERLDTVSPGLHMGEIGELVGLGPATPHRVPARPYAQKSIVYFALPANKAKFPDSICECVRAQWQGHAEGCYAGRTVEAWLKDRIARSRVTY